MDNVMGRPIQEWWQLSETDRVVEIIKEVGCSVLGNWDGCCCCNFSIRNVEVDISCGKGGEQAVWVSSNSCDYDGEPTLRPIMDEVIRQVTEQSGRGGSFAQFFEPWTNPNAKQTRA